MDNHYHLILETPYPNLSRCMQFLNSSYTTYHNVKNKRVGHLFQGRYKAVIVEEDRYIQGLSRYIHLNPVRANKVEFPEKFRWNSYVYYITKKNPPAYLKVDFVLNFFNKNRTTYKKFVEEGIGKEEDIFSKIREGFILGNSGFIETLKAKYLVKPDRTEDLPDLRRLRKKYISSEKILKTLKTVYPDNENKRNKFAVYFMRKFTDKTLQDIVNVVYGRKKMNSSAISKIVSRIDAKRGNDNKFSEELLKIEKKIKNVNVKV